MKRNLLIFFVTIMLVVFGASIVSCEGPMGHTPYIGDNGNWWINGEDTGIPATGPKGDPGEPAPVPYILNGDWYVGSTRLGPATGADAPLPYIGSNNNWWIDGTDTGVYAGGSTVPPSPVVNPWAPFTRPQLVEKMEQLHKEGLAAMEAGSGQDVGTTKMMQSFMMDLAIYAKDRNPNFQVIPQDRLALSRVNGSASGVFLWELMALVDGWGIENTGDATATTFRQMKNAGLGMATFTSSVTTRASLDVIYERGDANGILFSPRIGGGNQTNQLNRQLFPGKRWAEDYDYFWQTPLLLLDRGFTINSRDVFHVREAQNYWYHIHARNYDQWGNWDEETANNTHILTDRRAIMHSLGNGLLVPHPGGIYQPRANPPSLTNTSIEAIITEWGNEWDWWWIAEGYATRDAEGNLNLTKEELNALSRQKWVESMRDSPFDVIYLDPYYDHRVPTPFHMPLTPEEVDSLKTKPQGGRRQVIAYINIGAVEAQRWFAQKEWIYLLPEEVAGNNSSKIGFYGGSGTGTSWVPGPLGRNSYDPTNPANPEGQYFPDFAIPNFPSWLHRNYGGGYPEEAYVVPFHPEWRKIIIHGGSKWFEPGPGSTMGFPNGVTVPTTNNQSSMARILDQGFDGVYLDNISGASNNNYRGWWSYWKGQGYDMANGNWPD